MGTILILALLILFAPWVFRLMVECAVLVALIAGVMLCVIVAGILLLVSVG